jgi:hypothetical protein
VAIRFSDDLYSIGDTIGEHRDVIDRVGAVWLGKFGKTLAVRHVDAINTQIDAARPSYLYLIRKRQSSRGYDAFRGDIRAISRDEADVDRTLVPSYYDRLNLWPVVGVWIRLSSLEDIDPIDLEKVCVLRSNMPLAESLRLSMAGMFIVGNKQS